jgi:LysM repeat protein
LNGLWITLASTTGQSVSLIAAANPAASQITAGQVLFTPGPCSTGTSATYIGALNRQ